MDVVVSVQHVSNEPEFKSEHRVLSTLALVLLRATYRLTDVVGRRKARPDIDYMKLED